MNSHCWHKTWLAGSGFVKSYTGEVCCFCGISWSEHHKIPSSGHGKHDPHLITAPKPTDPCLHRLMKEQQVNP